MWGSHLVGWLVGWLVVRRRLGGASQQSPPTDIPHSKHAEQTYAPEGPLAEAAGEAVRHGIRPPGLEEEAHGGLVGFWFRFCVYWEGIERGGQGRAAVD